MVIACVWFIAVSNASFYCVALFLVAPYNVLLASWWMFLALIIVSIVISTLSYAKMFFTSVINKPKYKIMFKEE